MNHETLWNNILDELETKIDNETFDELFKNCYAYNLKNDFLTIIAPSAFVQTRINKLYLSQLNKIILKYTDGIMCKVKILLESEIVDKKDVPVAQNQNNPSPSPSPSPIANQEKQKEEIKEKINKKSSN